MRNLKQIIKEALEKQLNQTLILIDKVEISEALKYHIDNELSLTDNVFRVYSKGYFGLVNEVRNLWEQGKIKLNEEDTLMVESDLGKRVKIGEEIVYLDAPFELDDEEVLEEAKHRGKNVKLGLPSVIGYLVTGLMVSPFTPGFVADNNQLALLNGLG